MHITSPETDTRETTGCCKVWFDTICGMPKNETNGQEPSIEQEHTQKFLKEYPKWNTFLNVNACIGLIVTAFLYGFYR